MIRFAALAAAAALSAAAAQPAAAQDPLSFDNTVTCAAIFFAQSKQPAEQDEVEAFQMGMVEMITRAEDMNSGLNQDQIIERAAVQADQILAQVDATSGQDAKNQIIWNWGPGMNACIDAVLG
jgi:TolA-binding protein